MSQKYSRCTDCFWILSYSGLSGSGGQKTWLKVGPAPVCSPIGSLTTYAACFGQGPACWHCCLCWAGWGSRGCCSGVRCAQHKGDAPWPTPQDHKNYKGQQGPALRGAWCPRLPPLSIANFSSSFLASSIASPSSSAFWRGAAPKHQSTGWLDAAVLLPVLKLFLPLLTHQFYVRDQSLHSALIHAPHPLLPDFSHNC